MVSNSILIAQPQWATMGHNGSECGENDGQGNHTPHNTRLTKIDDVCFHVCIVIWRKRHAWFGRAIGIRYKKVASATRDSLLTFLCPGYRIICYLANRSIPFDVPFNCNKCRFTIADAPCGHSAWIFSCFGRPNNRMSSWVQWLSLFDIAWMSTTYPCFALDIDMWRAFNSIALNANKTTIYCRSLFAHFSQSSPTRCTAFFSLACGRLFSAEKKQPIP